MSQKTRILILVGVIILIGAVLAVIGLAAPNPAAQAPSATPQAGMIHLYVDGNFTANIAPADLAKLPAASFVDKEQGKTQNGYWLRDVVKVYVKESALSPTSQIALSGVRGGTEKKTATLTWAETLDPANNVLFSPSNDGQSVKVAGTMDKLATRDNWVQGLTQIDVKTK